MDYCIRYGGKNRWHCKFFLVYLHFIALQVYHENTYRCVSLRKYLHRLTHIDKR